MDAGDFLSGAENALVTQWVPQVEVLRRADLMINHAGIGSVQECIAMEVPMILFPLMRDQFACADRVIDLGLGVRGDLETVSVDHLGALISSVVGQATFKRKIQEARES